MTSEGAYGQEGLRQNDLVEKVMGVHPEGEPPIMPMFEGLVGESTEGGYWRLYFGSELDLCMEFPEDGMETFETVSKDLTALGFDLQKVWMKPETLITVKCRSQDLNAEMTAELLAILQTPQIGRGHRHK